jgi:hypothetical protein
MPARQIAMVLSQGQLQGELDAVASVAASAFVNAAATLQFTAAVSHAQQPESGHSGASPTTTQSVSASHDWS